ncbi:uncharacterized protein FA14DRAFT_155654 [Meira miltonrushii]|uniref:Uncharacterized protein n=1 Tax=Meira miltonrushii TaxID=1280837 RepID=A0A316VF46_9BASI|nr:uncharacterized protein FA14DRAFT_155654 [Meira miltonrushii]PWN36249.1 hypothetical protein FA14DRAFT_155654 [Meira miltonrushii]
MVQSGTVATSASAARATAINARIGEQHARIGSHDDPLLAAEEDGDDVFSNPDTAEYEYRSDATGATSPAPNSPGPGSPTNRLSNQISIVASSPSNDPFATIKQGSDLHLGGTGAGVLPSNKPMSLGSLPQTSIAQLQQQLEHQQARLDTPRAAVASATPTRSSPRPAFGRALSASGATMQTMGSSIHPSHSASGSRIGPSTPRLGGHSSSHSASHLTLPHGQLPSAHGLPTDPKEASTLSKLFAHPPAQSPAEELQGFMFASSGMSPNSTNTSNFAAHRRLSRPTTRPPSPDRFASPNRKSANRASAGAMGLGLSPRVSSGVADDAPSGFGNGSSIFERDIEHRDATHILSKQEAIDVAIPPVLDDAVEAIHSDVADQLEIVAPHAVLPPLALSAQALNAHSHSQSKLIQQDEQQSQPSNTRPQSSTKGFSSASSPYMSPSPPMSNVGAVEPPPGSMAAQIAERLAAGHKATTSTPATASGNEEGASAMSRHRRPNSDVSISSSSSMRSRSPAAPLAVGVQQVLAANQASPRSVSGAAQSIANTARTETHSSGLANIGTPRATLPTATALPALPLPNPYRTQSPSTTALLLPDAGVSMLPSVSMDGAVMPTSESATMDASFGSLADVIASQPPTSANSVANSPSMRLRGLALDDGHHHGLFGSSSVEASPYTSRSPTVAGMTSASAHHAPSSPLTGRSGKLSNTPLDKAEEYTAPSVMSGKKRLSFFSYADIINQTPAEILNFDEAVRQADSINKSSVSTNTPNSPTQNSPLSSSRIASTSEHTQTPNTTK